MAKKKETKPPFEDALAKLESIVNLMEEENLSLETLLTNYEEGQLLLSHCQSLLDNARERIEVVQLSERAAKEETENKLASEASAGDNPSPEDSSDDIRLL